MKSRVNTIDIVISMVLFVIPFLVVAKWGGSLGVFLLFAEIFVGLPLYWLMVFQFEGMGGLWRLPPVVEVLFWCALIVGWVVGMDRVGFLMPADGVAWSGPRFVLFGVNCWCVGLMSARSATVFRRRFGRKG